jgi:hypothetical protein
MDSMNTAEVQRAFGGVIVDDGRHTVPGIVALPSPPPAPPRDFCGVRRRTCT